MREAKALASLRICADSPEPSLLADTMRTGTELSCTRPDRPAYKKVVLFVLFDLILYVPSTIFQLCRDGSS